MSVAESIWSGVDEIVFVQIFKKILLTIGNGEMPELESSQNHETFFVT